MAATTSNPGVPVSYGIHSAIADAIGRTVAEVRQALAQQMNIPANAAAVVNGQRVTDAHVIAKGQKVEFVKEAGVGRGGSKYGILDYTELKSLCIGGSGDR